MDWAAHNAGYVIAAYAVSAACLVLLVAITVLRAAARKQAVERLKD